MSARGFLGGLLTGMGAGIAAQDTANREEAERKRKAALDQLRLQSEQGFKSRQLDIQENQMTLQDKLSRDKMAQQGDQFGQEMQFNKDKAKADTFIALEKIGLEKSKLAQLKEQFEDKSNQELLLYLLETDEINKRRKEDKEHETSIQTLKNEGKKKGGLGTSGLLTGNQIVDNAVKEHSKVMEKKDEWGMPYTQKVTDWDKVREDVYKRGGEDLAAQVGRMRQEAEQQKTEALPAPTQGGGTPQGMKGEGTQASPYMATSQDMIQWFLDNAQPGQVINVEGKLYTK